MEIIPTQSPNLDPSLPPQSWDDYSGFFDSILFRNMSRRDKNQRFEAYNPDHHHFDDLLAMLDAYEKDSLAEVETIISRISNTAQVDLSGFSPRAVSVATHRAEMAARALNIIAPDGKSNLRLPDSSIAEGIRWWLVDWWSEAGKQMAVSAFLTTRGA